MNLPSELVKWSNQTLNHNDFSNMACNWWLSDMIDSGPCEWQSDHTGALWVHDSMGRIMNRHMCYIHLKDTHIFNIFCCVWMLPVFQCSIRQYRKHNLRLSYSSWPCLQTIFTTIVQLLEEQRRSIWVHNGEIPAQQKWMVRYDNNSGVILLIQAPVNAKIASKWVMNTQADSDIASNF